MSRRSSELHEMAMESLWEEKERMLRESEQRSRDFMVLLARIAKEVAPDEYRERRYADPHFPQSLTTPEQWRAFFEAASFGNQHDDIPRGWQLYGTEEYQQFLAVKEKVEELEQAVRRLTQENERLTHEKHRLGARIQALQSQQSPAAAPRDVEESDAPDERGIFASHSFWPTLPEIPDEPPAQYAESFLDDTWERDAFAVIFLAVSGWAFRRVTNEAMVAYDDKLNSPKAGTFGRMWKRLRRNNLTTDAKYSVGHRDIRIVNLTEYGKAAARAIADIEPSPSEWDILLEKHGGEDQAKHNAGVVAFAYEARRRGYSVTLCPDVDHAAEPDVLLRKGEETLCVEVESGSGTEERLMRKWRNMVDLQDSIALCATTPTQQDYLVAQAEKVARHGKATNLHALKPDRGGNAPNELWLETW